MSTSSSDKELLKTLLELVAEPIFVLDQERQLIAVNSSMRAFVNFADADPVDLENFWPDGRTADLRREQLTSEFARSDGSKIPVTLQIRRIANSRLVIRVLSGVPQNETSENLHAHRLQLLGLLSGGIAHDINNILTGILGHASYLIATLPHSGTHIESLKAIEDGAKKSALMTRQIVNFSRASSDQETTIDLSKLIESGCNLLRGAISREYVLSFEVPTRPVFVRAVEGELTQVLINLVVNARDALKQSGEIGITLKERQFGSELPKFRGLAQADLAGMRCAEICVSDNGEGIPEHVIERMFQPYFSTKKDKGSGIGLSTVRSIIERSAGAIDVHSEINVGTSICVYLPLAMDKVLQDSKSPQRKIEQGNKERILVVDDEASVRHVLSLSLERLGYQVESAASAEEALARFTEAPEAYDLVILDMIMPEMSGREVFNRLWDCRPGVRVLISSAYSSDEAIKLILNKGGKGFIRKPYDIEELAKCVRECLSD